MAIMDMKIVNDFRRGCQVWEVILTTPKDIGPVEYNRYIRSWLTRNTGSGTWETNLTGMEFTDIAEVRVIFDIDAKEDAMAFKLRWL